MRYFFDLRSSRIAKPDRPRDLIKRLARGIVPCFSKNLIFPVISNLDKVRVTAGDNKTQKWRL